MKRFVINATQFFALLMSKHKDVDESKAFPECDARLKYDLVEVVNKCDKMFLESNVLPPKRGKQHEVQLQQDDSLLNIGMNKFPVLENAGIKK